MVITPDVWLSDIFTYPVFRLDVQTAPVELGNEVSKFLAEYKRAMCYVKFPVRDVALTRSLVRDGFYPVDVNVTFEFRSDVPSSAITSSSITISYDQEWYPEALRIAGECFQYSRFHLDPLIPKSIADLIKQQWVQNYIEKKRGDVLMIARKEDVVVGFLAAALIQEENRHNAVIELVGVDRSSQGQGAGKALVGEFISLYKAKCHSLQVGTQAANIPSMRLYERMGFSIIDSKYVMHRHHGSP